MPTAHIARSLPAESLADLKACINKLTNCLSLPALSNGGEPRNVLEALLDALLAMLALDFAYARWKDTDGGPHIEMVRLDPANVPPVNVRDMSRAMRRSLRDESRPITLSLQAFAGNGGIHVAPMRLGPPEDASLFVAGSRRPGFPSATEKLLLSTAVNQTLIVLKQARLLNAQRKASRALSDVIARKVLALERAAQDQQSRLARLEKRYARLTPREREVLTHVVEGKPNKRTAMELRIKTITVQVHRGRIMRKMKATSFAELVRMADRLGLRHHQPRRYIKT